MEIEDLIDPANPQFDAQFNELAQSSTKWEQRMGRMMLEFISSLRGAPLDARLFATRLHDRSLHLGYSVPDSDAVLSLDVAVDAFDYSPLDEDGVPRLHFRMSYRIGAARESESGYLVEERVPDVQSACDWVCMAIRNARK